MKDYVGMDLHSNNVCTLIIDEKEKWVLKRKFKTSMPEILEGLEPYRKFIEGIAIEATSSWYWLVDGLMDADYKVHLAHPGAIEGYSGKKRTNDFTDAFQLARLLKEGRLPKGYIYPKEQRPIRGLGRKRTMLVRNRTQHLLSFKGLVNRNLGEGISSNRVKQLSDSELDDLLENQYLALSGKANVSTVRHLTKEILKLEKAMLKEGRLLPKFQQLLTFPGIGNVLGLTIAYEIGELSRFEKVGNFLSYCRLVDSERLSNGKKKGKNNVKNGNKYLCWAYMEAANFAIRYCPYARVYHTHKLKDSGLNVLATKALASKIARASYYVMTKQEPYKPEKLFARYQKEVNALIGEKKGRGSKSGKGTGSQPIV